MRKFRLWVTTHLVGCKCEDIIECKDEDVPEDWETNKEFEREMSGILADSGMYDWGFEEIKD